VKEDCKPDAKIIEQFIRMRGEEATCAIRTTLVDVVKLEL
jgi:hypothetical protein